MGLKKVWWFISFCHSWVVGGWSLLFKYLTPFVLFGTFNLSSPLFVEDCQRIWERRKERDKDTVQLKLYFLGFNDYSVGDEILPETNLVSQTRC